MILRAPEIANLFCILRLLSYPSVYVMFYGRTHNIFLFQITLPYSQLNHCCTYSLIITYENESTFWYHDLRKCLTMCCIGVIKHRQNLKFVILYILYFINCFVLVIWRRYVFFPSGIEPLILHFTVIHINRYSTEVLYFTKIFSGLCFWGQVFHWIWAIHQISK